MVFLLSIIIVVIVMYFLLSLTKESDESIRNREQFQYEIDNNPLFHVKYLTGHRDINEVGYYTLDITNQKLCLCSKENLVTTIAAKSITAIEVVDKSTISERVTVGRVLLLGVWALWAKKQEHKRMYYLIIVWQESQLTHNTIFEYSTLRRANAARNLLIKKISVEN